MLESYLIEVSFASFSAPWAVSTNKNIFKPQITINENTYLLFQFLCSQIHFQHFLYSTNYATYVIPPGNERKIVGNRSAFASENGDDRLIIIVVLFTVDDEWLCSWLQWLLVRQRSRDRNKLSLPLPPFCFCLYSMVDLMWRNHHHETSIYMLYINKPEFRKNVYKKLLL